MTRSLRLGHTWDIADFYISLRKMSRMYSRKKGKSGSKKPVGKPKASWLRLKPKEIEMLIVKLAKEGKNAAQIGTLLRDLHGVPDVNIVMEKSISKILAEKDLAPKIPDDLMALIKRSVLVAKHLEENHKDKTAFRGQQLTTSKISRLVKYYKRSNRLPLDWKYDAASIKLYVE